jgi:hypothetical protein
LIDIGGTEGEPILFSPPLSLAISAEPLLLKSDQVTNLFASSVESKPGSELFSNQLHLATASLRTNVFFLLFLWLATLLAGPDIVVCRYYSGLLSPKSVVICVAIDI